MDITINGQRQDLIDGLLYCLAPFTSCVRLPNRMSFMQTFKKEFHNNKQATQQRPMVTSMIISKSQKKKMKRGTLCILCGQRKRGTKFDIFVEWRCVSNNIYQ